MSQAVAAYTTPVVRLARAASEPVKQPRMFRHYRRNSPDIAFLPLERIRRDNQARRAASAEEEPATRTDVLTMLVSALLCAMPEDAKRKAELSLISDRKGSAEARGIILYALGDQR